MRSLLFREWSQRRSSGNVTQTLMLSTNQVGSVQLVTDATTGEVVQRIQYDEFGRVLSDSAPGSQPFGFAGGLYDTETKLVRFGARDYASDVGRWVARDPARAYRVFGAYQYVLNTPITGRDENGLKPKNLPGPFDILDWILDFDPRPGIDDFLDLAIPDWDETQDMNREYIACEGLRGRGVDCCYAGDGIAYACDKDEDDECDPSSQSCAPVLTECNPEQLISYER